MKIKSITIFLISIGLLGCNGQNPKVSTNIPFEEILVNKSTLTQKEISGLDSLCIDFQFRGNCYAYSSPKNAEASNGEAHSDNLPKKIDQSFSQKGLYLIINPDELSKIDSTFLGCKLFLVNTTDSIVILKASDSRLNIIAEALNEKGQWTPISYLPSSWCGNSNHKVKLDMNEFWTFEIPVFKGAIKTKLRYVLLLDEYNKIISNEIVTHLNIGQFDKEKKQGKQSYNIMDPYFE